MNEFTANDVAQINGHGLNLDTVLQQMAKFQTGFPWADIVSPALAGDGVNLISYTDKEHYIQYYLQNKSKYKIVKFVPASGAATRMFQHLFEFLQTGIMNDDTRATLNNLDKFAFREKLARYISPNSTDADKIRAIVDTNGLNYGNLPKALLMFHKYAGGARTALEEHMAEGAQYAQSDGIVRLHFTVSPEHGHLFHELIEHVRDHYETRFGVHFEISMSTQKPSTDTIAVTPENRPLRNPDGSLLFRPAGHGALIENLNDIDADLIFIKNIDNVCPDSARGDTIEYKQMMGAILMHTQNQIFDAIRQIDRGTANKDKIRKFIEQNLGMRIDADTHDMAAMRAILDRPLRVCGIIRNTGAPGGGPFWVRGQRGVSLQIVEPGQIAPDKISILKDGEWFSPTDIVCAVRDINGKKYDLNKYVDTNAGFIVSKSKNGVPLRAMERPGLWNGAMADWNTVFVAVPGTTFTPVKTICDLLDAGHVNTGM